MGDMAETMNALKEHNKERRQARAEVNIDRMTELGIPATEQSKNGFRINTTKGAVMYYPSSNKWQHRGQVHRGDVLSFQGWLKNNKYLKVKK